MTAPTYGEEEDPGNMAEDCVQPTLGIAMVKQVLPSNLSARQVEQGYWEPSLD